MKKAFIDTFMESRSFVKEIVFSKMARFNLLRPRLTLGFKGELLPHCQNSSNNHLNF